ncbi:N-acetylneuraminate synthase family protein [Verrucomicrobia bacterium]|nr:N-acetylneuraminate synthase family protein [Verrucomicrobiota bacterium]
MGDFNFMISLIDESARIGADGIKFQVLLDYDSFISIKHSMYDEFKKGMFTYEEWEKIFTHTKDKGLDIVFMPICKQSLTLVKSTTYKIDYIDIHSISFYDEEVLKCIRDTKLPIILGIGGRSIIEIDNKIQYFDSLIKVLMVGFQAFPTNIEDVKIEKIKWLKDKYPQLDIGFADHSAWDSEIAIKANEWALILGATYFEKHLTIRPGEDRWDWQSALHVDKCDVLIKSLRFLQDKVFGHPVKDYDKIEGKELIYRNRQKVVVANKDLAKGQKLCIHDIAFCMHDNGEGITDGNFVLGKMLKINKHKGDIINNNDLYELIN